MELLCEVDGYLTEGIGWIEAPCRRAATHRYRLLTNPDAPWRYRCASCAKWSVLAPELFVEEIGALS